MPKKPVTPPVEIEIVEEEEVEEVVETTEIDWRTRMYWIIRI
jgi:hypothetical protein